MEKRAALRLLLLAAMALIGAAPESSIQTLAAFKTNVSYRYSCTSDVFTLAIGAVGQVKAAGETALYWEIWDSGQTSLGGAQSIAMLNTLQVQTVGTALQANGFPPGSAFTKAYRSCAGQSLYVWAASSVMRLPNGDAVVRFSDAVEQPLGQP